MGQSGSRGKEETGPVEETLATRNRQAWDTLYRRTDALVWGDRPIGFLEEFATFLRPHRALGKIPRRVRERVRRSVCDLARLPFTDGLFHGVLATDIIETLPDPEP